MAKTEKGHGKGVNETLVILVDQTQNYNDRHS